LLLGGVAGVWLRGLRSVSTLVLAVATAAGATAIATLWRWWVSSRRQPVRILTERDSAVADVFAGAKILTWVNVHVWLHQSDVAEDNEAPGGIPVGQPPEFREAAYQLRRTLWTLATDRADDPRAALAGMSH
jgi:hypothetical protein